MTAHKATASAENAADPQFSITRVFNAPRELVWKAWSEADSLAQWWGPKGFDIHIGRLEFRPGGIFHYRMQTGTGQTMWGRFAYMEIAAPERIVFVSSFSDEAGSITRAPFFDGGWPLEVHNTLTLAEQGGRTILTLKGAPINATEEERRTFEGNLDSMRNGFGGTFDQLDAYLTKA